MVSVVRVVKDIPSGTKTSELEEYISLRAVPRDMLLGKAPAEKKDDEKDEKVIGEDGTVDQRYLTSIDEIEDGVTEGLILAGELFTNERVMTDEEREAALGLRPGDVEVTLKLDGSRGFTKALKIGNKVTVNASFQSADGRPSTSPVIYSAVVSRINGFNDPEEDGAQADPESSDPDALISLAVTPKDAQKVIYAMEFGSIWLTLENASFDPSNLGPVTFDDLKEIAVPKQEVETE